MGNRPGPGVAATVELGVYRFAASVACAATATELKLGPASSARRALLEQRLGRWPAIERHGERALVWVHAASLGEVLVAGPLVRRLRARLPQARLLLSCQTATGYAAAERLGVDEVRYLPVDHPRHWRTLLDRVRPVLVLFVETEIWPFLLLALAERGVPAALVNARISDHSFPRYRLVSALMARVLSTFALVAARDRTARDRLITLGLGGERVSITGDLKLDGLDEAEIAATPDVLAGLRPDGDVLLAISTHQGEDEAVVEAFAEVRAAHPNAKLVVAPRHPERSAAVVAMAEARGHRVARWAAMRTNEQRGWDVLVVDTSGELRGFMTGAIGAFVGGSLVAVGGHNLLEPAAFGLPLVAGPHLDGVREQADRLSAAGALSVAHDAAGIGRCWRAWLGDPKTASAAGRAAGEAVRAGRGALERTLEALEPLLAAVSVEGKHRALAG